MFSVSLHSQMNMRRYPFVPVPAARSRVHHCDCCKPVSVPSHSPHHMVLDDWPDSLVVLQSSSVSLHKIGTDSWTMWFSVVHGKVYIESLWHRTCFSWFPQNYIHYNIARHFAEIPV